jgi:hypothetical protein
MGISRRFIKSIVTIVLVVAGFALTIPSCKNRSSELTTLTPQDSLRVMQGITRYRAEADSFFRYDPNSPFNKDPEAHFEYIRWFPPNLKYYFRSMLFKYTDPQTVTVFGTKGEPRNELLYGYFKIIYEGSEYRLNIYKTPPSGNNAKIPPNYLSVWFTDATTGKQTYGVGRYVEVGEEDPNPDHIYEINMNNAYNPYCAYSSLYSCAIPPKENHFDFPVLAGELKYHQ